LFLQTQLFNPELTNNAHHFLILLLVYFFSIIESFVIIYFYVLYYTPDYCIFMFMSHATFRAYLLLQRVYQKENTSLYNQYIYCVYYSLYIK